MQTEQPLRFMTQVAQANAENTLEVVHDGIENHIEHMHLPPKRTDPVQAIPFPDERIPDVDLARILERLQTEDCSLEEAAGDFGYPLTVVALSLHDYYPQWQKYLKERTRHDS